MGIRQISEQLTAAEAGLPKEPIAVALTQITEIQGLYQEALGDLEIEERTIIINGLGRLMESFEEMQRTMGEISEATTNCLARLASSGGAGQDFDTGTSAATSGRGSSSSQKSSARPTPSSGELSAGKPPATHTVSRQQLNATFVKAAKAELGLSEVTRAPVPDDKVSWDTPYPAYDPPFIDTPRGKTAFRKPDDYPDPDDPKQIERFDSVATDEVKRDKDGYPQNPVGRTGIKGRGLLNKWGPTAAADPIVTRHNPATGKLEVLLIKRGDTGEVALPGGKVDPGETPGDAAARELVEEAGVSGVELDFSRARKAYEGYVDDSRNTDNAWMETTALHLHLTPEQAQSIRVEAGSDATAAMWITADEKLYSNLFASHGQYLRAAIDAHVAGQS